MRYVVVDPATRWCARARFAAYVPLPSGIDSGLTFERYLPLDQAKPLFDGNRAWTYLTRHLGFSSHSYGGTLIEPAAFDVW